MLKLVLQAGVLEVSGRFSDTLGVEGSWYASDG
jgi:hypothetical protein